jgi:hypothetical protein
MGKRPLLIIMAIVLVAACVPSQPDQKGPLLVKEITLPPTTPVPTRILSPTPEPVIPIRSTSELISPLEMVTLEADFVLVTPTLPPSKTPTETPTITLTATRSPTPTVTVTATATAPLFPTSIIDPVTAAVANPLAEVCDSSWFFLQPRPAGCPLSAPLASQGVFQRFQNGYMIWVQNQEAIYVMYDDLSHPRWQVFKDNFVEGAVEDDPAYTVSPYPDTWQPRRGFGLLWRANMGVRERIGWATERFEHPYSVQTQTAPDGVIFISDALDGLFSLTPNGLNWQRFTGYEGF